MSLASRINEIRKSKNLSVDELCERSGIPKGTLSKITAGITTSPTLDTVRAIANALNCTLDDLDDKPLESKKSPDGAGGGAEGEPGDDLRSILIRNFDQLNQEGQERLVETSDDMVSSGKYIKSDKNQLGKAQGA